VPRRSIASIVNDLLLTKGSFTSGELARRAGITRQAVHRHLQSMLGEGALVSQGKGPAVRYFEPPHLFHRRYLRQGLREDEVWSDVRRAFPQLDRPDVSRARAVLAYAFTEMLNNAVDHSGSRQVEVRFELGHGGARFDVIDEGIGVFENARAHLGLPSGLAALQEISKGKTTTQPAAHSGQGIFFTSKVGDRFELEGNGLRWSVDNRRDDVAISEVAAQPGTRVGFEVSLATDVDVGEVFARYSRSELEFDTSRVVVKLFEHGVAFVSRSEAKRLLAGLEKFRHVILDFNRVESVGQGFCDEIFRVWGAAHPEVTLEPVNASAAVELTIQRATPHMPGGEPLVVQDVVRRLDFPLGWTERSIETVIRDADARTDLEALRYPDGVVVVSARRNRRDADWTYVGIAVTTQMLSRTTVQSVFILGRGEARETLWAAPTEALRAFVEIYGRELTVGQSPSKRFFLDEVYPMTGHDPNAPPITVPHPPRPSHPFFRGRRSALGVAAVGIAYVIDYEKYAAALARTRIHIAFS
jgi:anti-sigma regulatory factor (Ser/Thr protein kinase)